MKVKVADGGRQIYPRILDHQACCPNQKCYTRLEDGGFAEGIVKEQNKTTIILRDSGKCRHSQKIYKPVKVELSISCNCLYSSPAITEENL